MSAEIEKFTDMTYVGQVPWHSLGVPVTEIKDLPDCLNWEVHKQALFLGGQSEPISGYMAITRDTDKRVFGIASEDYVPHQNKDLWKTFVDFCNEGGMSIETAGALRGGEIIWILAKILGQSAKIGEDYDINNLYALIGSGHNNKMASFTKPTAIRVVCQNTFNLALNDGKIMDRQIHRHEFDVKQAKDFVTTAILGFKVYQEQADMLSKSPLLDHSLSVAFATELMDSEKLHKAIILSTNGRMDLKNSVKQEWVNEVLSKDAVKRVFDEELEKKRTRPVKDVLEAILTEETATPNWWHEFNGITRYVDHVRSRTADTRLYNSWFGTGNMIKKDGFELATEYAQAA